ncbi:methyltransferase domain-containing protein [Paenibacillus prosopidis]|uniref:Methyltransferase family protein n=1 Tax=Paenibacillus prosopidis TaxID=630520 RepID=A0A368W593_9BACL|nr:methyltransferase domain-containing protein [Paenibacillus prosopidis]RCW50264.1 methyltransferase family protein [Paenibacillus prosopidis]
MENKHTFNAVANEYEKFRPSYPSELFQGIIQYSLIEKHDRILEIGCGTGQATSGLVDLGYEHITCVELGKNLADITTEKFKHIKSINVINSAFEDWEGREESYSLAISATAFHFIQPEIGYPKVSKLLKNKGSAAFFWTVHEPSFDEIYSAIRDCYQRYAPQLDDINKPSPDEVINERLKITEQTNLFDELAVKEYRWFQEYTSEQFISFLNTHSGHRLLAEDIRESLFNEIKDVIDQYGGVISKPHLVALFLARKK